MRGLRRRLSLPVALVALAASATLGSCSGDASPYDELGWSCSEAGASCLCLGKPDAEQAGSAPSCPRELDCCFVKARGDGSTECTCLDVEAGEGGAGEGGAGGAVAREIACHGAALEHGSTEVVERCPPVTLDSAGVCALAYEACDPAYLESIGLVDCCEGTRCAADRSGTLLCQPD